MSIRVISLTGITRPLMGAALLVGGGIAHSAAEPLVDVEWLTSNIGQEGVVVHDVRGGIAGKTKADYLRAHIPGSVWTNYLKDGWRIKDKNGTPGQLANTEDLEKLIGSLGINNDTHVVIVPQGSKAVDIGTGTRIFWTFKVLGHDNVSILNGGMTAYTKAKDDKTKKPVNPLDKGAVEISPQTFTASLQEDMIIDKEDVKQASAAGATLVDHRPNNQYLGINKHGKAKRSGTIPGAKNIPENWMTANGGGTFRGESELTKLFDAAGVATSGDQINFCNSGHWASIGWFVSHEIMGNDDAKMYDGSMLEWSADKSLPMEQHVKLQ